MPRSFSSATRPSLLVLALAGVAGLLAVVANAAGEDARPPALPRPDASLARPLPPEPKLSVKVETDPAEVFRRVLWRHPSPAEQLVQAERREIVDETGAVRAWAAFLVFQPGRELSEWLFSADPFALSPVAGPSVPESAPAWFPSAEVLGRCSAYRSRTSALLVFRDEKTGLLYVSDAGSGFAAPSK